MSSPRLDPQARILRERRRAFAIGSSTFVFVVVMWAALQFGYEAYDGTAFFLLEGTVILVCFILNPDFYFRLALRVARAVRWTGGEAGEELGKTFGRPDNGRKQILRPAPTSKGGPERSYWLMPWTVAASLLAIAILADFVSVGLLINGTGGITTSPFLSYAFTMIVLGIVMATGTLTMLSILGAGLGFFAVLAYASVLGTAQPDDWRNVETLRGQFLVATAVNLVISWFVNWVARAPRRQPPAILGGTAKEPDPSPGKSPLEGMPSRSQDSTLQSPKHDETS